MRQFQFWYSETDTFRASFEAESLEEAQQMIDEIRDGRRFLSDLPKFDSVGKSYEFEYLDDTLKEVGLGRVQSSTN